MGLSNVNPYPALRPQGQLEALPWTLGLYIPPQLPSALLLCDKNSFEGTQCVVEKERKSEKVLG